MTHTINDLFDGESLLGDPNDLDNLVEFRDGTDNNPNDDDVQEDDGGGNEDEADEAKESSGKKSEEKKVVRVKRPQPRLNFDRLKGPRGLLVLRDSFKDFKFYGKGREAEDLSRLLSRLEHWAHRLFPKMEFDDFLDKVEKLGSKKVVQNYLKRIRMGMEDSGESVERLEDSDTEEHGTRADGPPPDEPMDEFDRLLGEQVSFYQNASVTSVSTTQTPSTSTPPTPSPFRPPMAASSASSSLTAEQRERIERNRRAAMEKRLNRLAATPSPVTAQPRPISPSPGEANASVNSSNSSKDPAELIEQEAPPQTSEKNQSLAVTPSGECPSTSGDSSDSINSSLPSSDTALAAKIGAEVLPSDGMNIIPEPTTSSVQSVTTTSCDSPLDVSDSSDKEKPESPAGSQYREGTSKRSGTWDAESSRHKKKTKKDFPSKELHNSGSGDDSRGFGEDDSSFDVDAANFVDHLEKISSDGMENDYELSNAERDNNNIKENGSQAENTQNNTEETSDDPEK